MLTTTLVHHQHFFPVVTDDGELKEAFLAVVNTQPADERLIAKNAERVVTARLRDAQVFLGRGSPHPARRSPSTGCDTLVFHKKLGSYRDKAERIEGLARTLAADVSAVAGAGRARRDRRPAGQSGSGDRHGPRVSPSSRGSMGGVYAREEGQPEAVWKAIYYHYLPVGVEADAPPSRAQLGAASVTWAALSMADQADTLAGLFSAGEKPTGSRDPFALRRAAQALIKGLVDLPEVTGVARPVRLAEVIEPATAPFILDVAALIAFYGFLLDRLRYVLEQRGFDQRNVRAVTHEAVLNIEPVTARRKLEVLPEFTSSPDFRRLATAFKRVRNIAREMPADEATMLAKVTDPPLRARLKEDAELALCDEIEQRQSTIEQAIANANFRQAFAEAARFGPAVDRFFTEVFVMVDDAPLKRARLQLMQRLESLILSLADISDIVPQSE